MKQVDAMRVEVAYNLFEIARSRINGGRNFHLRIAKAKVQLSLKSGVSGINFPV
jgi:hypothetical protein